ncbi:MAG: choice-of-anchor Q domain-containing protein [Pirellulaceae bacterium]
MTKKRKLAFECMEARRLLALFAGWNFDEGSGTRANPVIGSANGTIDGATFTGGKFGRALNFDGVNDRVTFGTGPSLDGTTSFTVSAWVRTTSTSDGVVIQQRNGGFDGEYVLSVLGDGRVNFFIFGGGQQQADLSSSATVNDGAWHHIAATREGLNTLIYVDGQVSGISVSINPFPFVAPLDNSIGVGVGADIRDNNRFFDGQIDAVRVYDSALSANDVFRLQAQSQQFIVDSSGDGGDANLGDGLAQDADGNTTLRAAVEEANAVAGADTIAFDETLQDSIPGDEFFSITVGSELRLVESVAITGFEDIPVSISGADQTRIITAGGPGEQTFTLEGLVLARGNGEGSGNDGVGGAVSLDIALDGSNDTLNIRDSTIRNSSATNSGGGISSDGNTNIERSAIVNNNSTNGAGAVLVQNNRTTIVNSTISGNQSENLGGGIVNLASGEGRESQLTLVNVTLANNTGLGGANVRTRMQNGATSATTRSTNTIFAQPDGSANIGGNGTFTSLGGNIIDDDSGTIDTNLGDQRADPMLLSLRTILEPRPFHPLPDGSPAIDAGRDTFGDSVTTDQRGFPRLRGAYDSGAYEAAFVTVTTELDTVDNADNLVSLREAVSFANAHPDISVIRFDPSLNGTPVRLTRRGTDDTNNLGDLDILRPVAIGGNGVGNTIIDGGGDSGLGDRIFDVQDVNFALRDLTVRGGRASNGAGLQYRSGEPTISAPANSIVGVRFENNVATATGGAVRLDGELWWDIRESTFINNHARNGGAIIADGVDASREVNIIDSTFENNTATNLGGGVYVDDTQLSISRSTFDTNSATGGGGGLVVLDSTSASVTNSTFSGNTSPGLGSAILNVANGPDSESEITIINATITQNTTTGTAAVHTTSQQGATRAEIKFQNSIFVDNINTNGSDFAANVTSGSSSAGTGQVLTSLGNNLFDDTGFGSLIASDLANVNTALTPVLESELKSNLGKTKTHALAAGSPAIDAGADNITNQDQRSLPRPHDAIDIGASEVQPLLDFGDAPAGYPVTLAQDGARHETSSLFLGSLVDGEGEGQPDDQAGQGGTGGDDNNGQADEDGVFVLASMVADPNVATTSSFQVVASASGFLDAWIDFDNDGNWNDPGEQIFASRAVSQGNNVLSYTIPAGATTGNTAARFRISPGGGLAPTGRVTGGEVEDYIVELVGGSNVNVEVTSITPGSVTIETSGADVVVRDGDTVLFQSPIDGVSSVDFIGSDDDDTVLIDAVMSELGSDIGFHGGSGRDTLSIGGVDQVLNVAGMRHETLTGVDVIDLTGSGNNQLFLSESDVNALPDSGRTLRVKKNFGDRVTFTTGNFVIDSTSVENGALIVRAASSSIAVEFSGQGWTNPLNPLDVNGNNEIEPLDALIIINELSRKSFVQSETSSDLVDPATVTEFPMHFFDTNGDGLLAPIDALRVINGIVRANVPVPGFRLSKTTATVSESDGNFSDSFTIVLTSQPSDRVVLGRRFYHRQTFW